MTEGTANVMEYVLGAALDTAETLLKRMEEGEAGLGGGMITYEQIGLYTAGGAG